MPKLTCHRCHKQKPFHLAYCQYNPARYRHPSLKDEQEYFLTKVRVPDDPNACWGWLASLTKFGYGRFRYKGHMTIAHRVAWLLFVGDIPDGLDVLHDPVHCKSRACTNWKRHLRLGTDKENAADRRISGTHIEGGKGWNAKLTDELVQQMRYEYHILGIPPRALAKKYDVHGSVIVKVCTYERWTHVPDLPGVKIDREAARLINRLPRGSANPASKLTEEQVREIRHIRQETGLFYYKIAEQYGVSQRVIWLICNGGSWTHVL